MSINIFFCYAHEDEEYLTKIKKHLKPLQKKGLINMWHDRDISAGAEWEKEINEHMNAAHVILLLVSSDFMGSDYCYGIEMEKALERYEHGEALVIPIILRAVYWQDAPFGRLQALPKNAQPIIGSGWKYPDEAFYDMVQGLIQVIKQPTTQSLAILPPPSEEIPRSVPKTQTASHEPEPIRQVQNLNPLSIDQFQSGQSHQPFILRMPSNPQQTRQSSPSVRPRKVYTALIQATMCFLGVTIIGVYLFFSYTNSNIQICGIIVAIAGILGMLYGLIVYKRIKKKRDKLLD